MQYKNCPRLLAEGGAAGEQKENHLNLLFYSESCINAQQHAILSAWQGYYRRQAPKSMMIPPNHGRLTPGIANKPTLSGTTAVRSICC